MSEESDAVDRVYRELETVSLRAVSRARRMSAPLSFVEHSLLSFIAANPGCRAIDIAADFSLNRSTVSRQLTGLESAGLVGVGIGEEPDGRGRPLHVTSKGEELLARSVDANRAALAERLVDWPVESVGRLADALNRLNTAFDGR
ncbi:MarR family winged helix-turn-helix transcriptional regulator [Frigoribacterium sp. 2-23]|uniref:MarR family winged helix-turn-helix transcriptional regulator n=1 Tax=Frigoribacterium sp. 2-23 TaxID=3415006 RepID=UPI003C6FAAC7